MVGISSIIKRSRLIILFAVISLALQYVSLGFAGVGESAEPGRLSNFPEPCEIIPKEGTCKGNFHVIYFDAAAGKCREVWGCYEDVFKSMDACRNLCETNAPSEASPSEALLLYLNQGGCDPNIVRNFIEYRADVNFHDNEYHIAPLHNAAHYGHPDVVRVLLEHGAAIDAKNAEGNTPLFAAVHQQHPAVARILLEKGADVNAKNMYGYAPVRAASRNGNGEILKLLIEKGADVNIKDKKGDTPLLVAVEEGNIETVKILIAAGADVNVIGSHGGTPLHTAAAFGFADIVKILVEKGAKQDVKDRRNNTPLDLAEQRGYAEIVSILNKYRK